MMRSLVRAQLYSFVIIRHHNNTTGSSFVQVSESETKSGLWAPDIANGALWKSSCILVYYYYRFCAQRFPFCKLIDSCGSFVCFFSYKNRKVFRVGLLKCEGNGTHRCLLDLIYSR